MAVLSRFEAVVVGRVAVAVGRVAGRAAVVLVLLDVREVLDTPVGFVAGLVDEAVPGRVAVLLDAVVPAMLERRSKVDVVVFGGALEEVVPTKDMRLAEPEIPLLSSPELATDLVFSSAELLTEGRDRWEAVVEVLSGLRTVPEVVGRVGGLLSVLPLAAARAVDAAVLVAPETVLGRLAAAVPDNGRFVVVVVFSGEDLIFSLSLIEASGLVTGPSLPDRMVESTGVAGGAISASTSAEAGASAGAGAGAGTGSSVEAIMDVGRPVTAPRVKSVSSERY